MTATTFSFGQLIRYSLAAWCIPLFAGVVSAQDGTLGPNVVLKLRNQTEKAGTAGDQLATLHTEVKAIAEAVKSINGGVSNATKLVEVLAAAARNTENAKKLRIESIQALADAAIAVGGDETSAKALLKRIKDVDKKDDKAARDAKTTLDELSGTLGSIDDGSDDSSVFEAIVNGIAAKESLAGQIKLYDEKWKKELVASGEAEPKTLRDKVDKLVKESPGRTGSAINSLMQFVSDGYPDDSVLPSPDASRMSNVAFDTIEQKPVEFFNQLNLLIRGEPVEVEGLQRRATNAVAGIGAAEARTIGTSKIIAGPLAAALSNSSLLIRHIAADGVLAMVTAEKADKRIGLLGTIVTLRDDQSESSVKQKLTGALAIIATDVQAASTGTAATGEAATAGGTTN